MALSPKHCECKGEKFILGQYAVKSYVVGDAPEIQWVC